MVEGVVADQVAGRVDLGHQVGVLHRLIAEHEEGGRRIELVERLEHVGRPARIGAVVEREHDVLAGRAAALDHEAGRRLRVACPHHATALVDLHLALTLRGLGANRQHLAVTEQVDRAALGDRRQHLRARTLLLADELPQRLVLGAEAPQRDALEPELFEGGGLVPGAERVLAPHVVGALLIVGVREARVLGLALELRHRVGGARAVHRFAERQALGGRGSIAVDPVVAVRAEGHDDAICRRA